MELPTQNEMRTNYIKEKIETEIIKNISYQSLEILIDKNQDKKGTKKT